MAALEVEDGWTSDEDEFFLIAITSAARAVAANEAATKTRRRPYRRRQPRTNAGAGAQFTQELLTVNSEGCFACTRLTQPALKALIDELTRFGLKSGRYVTAAEKTIIFLQWAAERRNTASIRHQYAHGKNTVAAAIHQVTDVLCRMASEAIAMPRKEHDTAPKIKNDSLLWPYLEGCIGAVDGTYIPSKLPQRGRDSGPWRNRKGFLSQNVLLACNMAAEFIFVQAGHEGSANDSSVFNYAAAQLKVPKGCYLLADGGYSKKNPKLLVPYQKTRYHLREQQAAGFRTPATKEELFNLRHAQARNVIERLIGIQKKRWSVLADGPHQGWSMKEQARFVIALCVVHNFIFQNGQTLDDDATAKEYDAEMAARLASERPDQLVNDAGNALNNSGDGANDIEDDMMTGNQWTERRNNIASDMMEGYLKWLERHRA
jgi:hypothetical protein